MSITRKRGDTYADAFLVSNESTGEIVNLTGCSALMTLNTEQNPTDISNQLYQLTGVISSPSSGVIEFSPNSTQANNVGFYYYDIQLTDANGIVRTIDSGTYVYSQDITKN